MKTNNDVKYTQEPKGKGWKFDSSRRLTKSETAAAGIPTPAQIAAVEWERTETKGAVTLRPVRGGARAGAGRKSKGHVRMQLLVSPATRRKIEAVAKRRKLTLSEAVDQIVDAA